MNRFYFVICAATAVQSLWRTEGSTVGRQGLDHAEATRKAKVTRLLESTDLAWALSSHSAKIFKVSLKVSKALQFTRTQRGHFLLVFWKRPGLGQSKGSESRALAQSD